MSFSESKDAMTDTPVTAGRTWHRHLPALHRLPDSCRPSIGHAVKVCTAISPERSGKSSVKGFRKHRIRRSHRQCSRRFPYGTSQLRDAHHVPDSTEPSGHEHIGVVGQERKPIWRYLNWYETALRTADARQANGALGLLNAVAIAAFALEDGTGVHCAGIRLRTRCGCFCLPHRRSTKQLSKSRAAQQARA
jgi:hypothetical protein